MRDVHGKIESWQRSDPSMKHAHLLSAYSFQPSLCPSPPWSCIFSIIHWLDELFISLGRWLLVMIMLQGFQRVLPFSFSAACSSLRLTHWAFAGEESQWKPSFCIPHGTKSVSASPLNISQLSAQWMIFCSEGKYSWGYPWTTNIFCALATWMSQVLQGNNHPSLSDSFGLSLGGRQWAYFKRAGFWHVGLCALPCDLQCRGLNVSGEFRVEMYRWPVVFYCVGSECVPPFHLFDSYSGCPQTSVSFWFTTTSDPLCCLTYTLFTCGSYFNALSWKTYSLLPSRHISMQVTTLLKCLEGHLQQ